MALGTKRTLVLGGISLAVLLAGWLFVDVAARRSSFCDNCHYMAPYVEQWKASTHSQVDCVECHPTQRRDMFAQLVKYATGTYRPRPKAYVPDSACSQEDCHPDMAAAKPTSFSGITFPHAPHLAQERRGIRLHCASCHGFTHEAGHVAVDQRVCFLCHFEGQRPAETVGACGACHGAPGGMSAHGGFLFDMKSYVDSGVACSRCHLSVHEGDGAVGKEKCYACHISRAEEYGETKLVHEVHVTGMRARCLDCHEPIRHGNVKVASVLEVSCESCHANLHGAAKEMYLGVGGKGAADTPSRMFAAQINCTGCHTQVLTRGGTAFLGQSNKTADPMACAACHDARYVPMVARWKQQGEALAAEARRLASEGTRLYAASKGAPEAASLTADLEFNARFLEQGHPVHNIEYAIRILQGSRSLLAKLGEAAGRPGEPAIRADFAKDDFSYCTESCHGFIARAEPYDFQGVDVPHSYHVKTAGLSCDTCHEAGKHKALALGSPKDCAPCHHDSAQASCARCHPRQEALYRGTLPVGLGMKAAPDTMAASVGCADCHDPTKSEPLAEVAKSCEGCHDAQGSADLAAWRKELGERRDRVRALEDEARLSLGLLTRRQEPTTSYSRRLRAVSDRVAYLDGAGGVHNFKAATEELGRAESELRALTSEMTREK
ncbi:MAG: hypothetical protein AB1347_11040 [Acidobacteriota bacterium]